MKITDIIAIGFFIATGILIFFAVRGKLLKKTAPKAKSGPPPANTKAGTTTPPTSLTSGTTLAPPTPPAQKTNWAWAAAFGAIGIAIIIWVIAPWLRNPPASPLPPPAAKRELQKRVVSTDLRFIGGDGVLEKEGLIGIRRGGQAFFLTHNLPWRKDAEFHVVVRALRRTTGNVRLTINGGRGGEKFLIFPGSSDFLDGVFFDSGEKGLPAYFNPGTNQIIIAPIGDDLIIQCVRIEMIYWE
jgi:hypothetical protein